VKGRVAASPIPLISILLILKFYLLFIRYLVSSISKAQIPWSG